MSFNPETTPSPEEDNEDSDNKSEGQIDASKENIPTEDRESGHEDSSEVENGSESETNGNKSPSDGQVVVPVPEELEERINKYYENLPDDVRGDSGENETEKE